MDGWPNEFHGGQQERKKVECPDGHKFKKLPIWMNNGHRISSKMGNLQFSMGGRDGIWSSWQSQIA
jgi:hypothetical protein